LSAEIKSTVFSRLYYCRHVRGLGNSVDANVVASFSQSRIPALLAGYDVGLYRRHLANTDQQSDEYLFILSIYTSIILGVGQNGPYKRTMFGKNITYFSQFFRHFWGVHA